MRSCSAARYQSAGMTKPGRATASTPPDREPLHKPVWWVTAASWCSTISDKAVSRGSSGNRCMRSQAGHWRAKSCSAAATLTSRRSSGSQAFRRGADTASCKSPGAVSAASIARASPAERVSRPTLSSDGASGCTPCVGIRPCVVFRPSRPQVAAGIRTEPAVSVPSAP